MKALLFFSGLFTLVAQTALVREVLATGGTNELVLGILLGAWLAWVGGGALLAGLFPVEEKERAAAQARRAAWFFLPAPWSRWGGPSFSGGSRAQLRGTTSPSGRWRLSSSFSAPR